LIGLKAAIDHAATGNYQVEFDIHGESEVLQLATSVRKLLDHIHQKE